MQRREPGHKAGGVPAETGQDLHIRISKEPGGAKERSSTFSDILNVWECPQRLNVFTLM